MHVKKELLLRYIYKQVRCLTEIFLYLFWSSLKCQNMGFFYGFLSFCLGLDVKLGIDTDEANQKASISKAHYM